MVSNRSTRVILMDQPKSTLVNDKPDPQGAVAGLSIAVLVPCFNEEQTVGTVVRNFQKALPQARIYVYDIGTGQQTLVTANSDPTLAPRWSPQMWHCLVHAQHTGMHQKKRVTRSTPLPPQARSQQSVPFAPDVCWLIAMKKKKKKRRRRRRKKKKKRMNR